MIQSAHLKIACLVVIMFLLRNNDGGMQEKVSGRNIKAYESSVDWLKQNDPASYKRFDVTYYELSFDETSKIITVYFSPVKARRLGLGTKDSVLDGFGVEVDKKTWKGLRGLIKQ